MKRAVLVTAMLAALTSVAGADVIGAPPGWNYDEGVSRELTRKAQSNSPFGAIPSTKLQVEAFLAPSGGSLFVTRIEATVPDAQRNVVATRALFELVDSARRQGSAQIEASAQRADPATRQLEATITWRDPAGLRQLARTLVVGDATHLVALIGECILPTTAAKDVEHACATALTALDTGIAPANRVALAIVDAPAETALPPIATAPTETGPVPAGTTTSASSRMREQPRLGDGGRAGMAPMTIAPATREIDRRPLYLGGGIVVLAALFWWNRRRRDRFEREDGPASATTETEPEASSGDEDADDLQAAAGGDAPKRDD